MGGQSSSTVSVFLANGDGTFTVTKHDLQYYPSSLATGDFNGDGKPDLAIVSQHGGAGGVGGMTLFPGKGDGSLEAPIYYSPGGLVTYPSFVAVADFNGDGRADLVVSSNLPIYYPVDIWLGVFASITATGGTPQSTSPGQPFATALQATVRDIAGNPVQGAPVTFTPPADGPTTSLNTSRTGVAEQVFTDARPSRRLCNRRRHGRNVCGDGECGFADYDVLLDE